MVSKNVLVTCGGKWVGMILHLQRALDRLPTLAGGRVFVADRAKVTPAGCFADGSFVVPEIAAPDYVDRLVEICASHDVRVLVPLIDIDLNRLAPELHRFAAVGTSVVCPSAGLTELCFDKAQFQSFAEDAGLNPPVSYSVGELANAPYPLFHKRRRGFGSIGVGLVRTERAAHAALAADPDLLFQEYVDAPEVSVDAVISQAGPCVVRVQRIREKVVGGEAWQSRTIRSSAIRELAARAIEVLSGRGLRGPLNVQIFAADEPRINEVNPRLGSASVFSNFACDGRLFDAVLRGACGEAVEGDPEDYRDDVRLFRFLGDVYHDGESALGILPSGGVEL